jgi:hypothetical protein
VTRASAVSLSDRQQRMVSAHAASLPAVTRDYFLRSIADGLRGEPSDSAVAQAINIALDRCHAYTNGTNN